MRETTDNPYLLNINSKFGDYTLNSYLFGEFVTQKAVDANTLLMAMRELLAALGFDIAYMGFEFLVKLVAIFYSEPDIDADAAVIKLSQTYGTEERLIRDNINAILKINGGFAARASKLLKREIALSECTRLQSAVWILSAVFKTYYHYAVDGGDISDGIQSVNYLKVIFNGN